MTDFLEKTFRLKEHQTDVRTEILAGITTFMTMAYILAVNPGILSAAGMDAGAVFTATALGACLGTLLMALFSNYPSGYGPERLFCLYCCRTDGLQLAGCVGSSFC